MISNTDSIMLNEAMRARNYTVDTQKNYRSQIIKFCVRYGKLYNRATVSDLTKYISEIENVNYMASTYSALKFFYTYILKQKKKFPFIPFPEKESRLKNIPTREQILMAIDLTDNTKHKLILSILFGTGIRLSELLNIKWKDIRREKNEINPLSILIHGKGKKDRVVPISKRLDSLFKEYCAEYKLGCNTNKDHYILGGVKQYSKRSVAKVVSEAGERIGIHLHPHLIRHATFTYLRDIGKDIPTIAELAGHSSFKTTQKYARLNPVKIEMPV